MKKYLHRSKSVFFSWLISYVCIMVITLIISTFAYYKSINVIKSENSKFYMESLNQLQQAIDSKLSDVEKISIEASLNNYEINYLVTKKEPMNEKDIIESSKIISGLESYVIANKFISNLYIFFKHNNFIISNNAKYDVKLFYDIYYNGNYDEFLKWENMISNRHSQEFIPLTAKTKMGEAKSVAFMQSLPITEKSTNNATMVIEISEDAIQNAIEEFKWVSQGTAVFIENKNNDILASSQKDIIVPDSLKYNNLIETRDILKCKINNEKVMALYSKSNITDWTYVAVIPESVFLQKVRHVFSIICYCIILCLIIGGIIAYILSKLNYNPIHKLIGIFNYKPESFTKYKDNEYTFIEKSIIDMINDLTSVQDRLDQQKRTLKTNFLSALIKGQVGNGSFEDSCTSYGIQFDGSYFTVILLYITHFDDIYFDTEKVNNRLEKTISTVNLILENTIEGALKGKFEAYLTAVNDIPACLINLKENNDEIKQEIASIILKSKDCMENKFAIHFSAAISNIHTGENEIPEAYHEAMEALEYRMILGNNRVILYDQINPSYGSFKDFNNYIFEEQQFFNCVKIGDYKGAKLELEKMFETNFTKSPVCIQVAKCRMYGLINIMFNVFGEISISIDNDYIKNLDIYNQLINCITIDELKSKMTGILDSLSNYFENKRVNSDSALLQDIITFVEENYSRYDLNVSLIADKFNLNIVNLSKFFKKNTGIGMLEYIHKFRINKAKTMMKDENLSIKEIGEKVGYCNSATFIKVFKKNEGITPGRQKISL